MAVLANVSKLWLRQSCDHT